MSDTELERLLAQRDEIDKKLTSRQREMAVLFTDIVGSTELFERRGDVEGVAFIHRHNRLLFPVVEEHGGRIVKTIGDAIMAVFEDPAAAVLCAADMQGRLAEIRRAEPGELPIHIKVGIHFGKVVPAGEDVFGDAVNTAARVQGQAGKDEIVVSESLQSLVAERTGIPAVQRGAVPLKGKADPLPIASLRWGPEAPMEEEAATSRDEPVQEEEEPGRGVRASDEDDSSGHAKAPDLFVLEIAKSAAGLKVAALDGPGDKGPVKSYAEVSLPSEELETITGRMAAFLGGSAGSYADRMADTGRELFDRALSSRAKQRLSETSLSFLRMQVDDSIAHVPWELLHDGRSHLCLGFATGRVVAARDDEDVQIVAPKNTAGTHALVVSNPTGDLPASADEGEAVAGLLEEGFGAKVRHLEGPITRHDLLKAMEGARLLHFAGHVTGGRGDGEHGFRLTDGCLSPDVVAEKLGTSTTDLVFANACNAHDTTGWTDAARGTFDLASTLLMRGVRHYLGPVGAIEDSDALTFALRFYEEALAGVPFGEAARRARKALAGKSTNPLSFARYVLYGEPRSMLPRDVAILPAQGKTRADPMMPPGAAVSDGIPFPPPAGTAPTAASEASWEAATRPDASLAKRPSETTGALTSARGRRRALIGAVAGLAVLASGTWVIGGLFEEGEIIPREDETIAAPDRPTPEPTGDIRMEVLDLQPMGGDPDPSLTERLRNTLNFALVGAPGISVTDRYNLDQIMGTEPGEGELRLQAESMIMGEEAFDESFRAELGRLRGLEVAVVGGYQEAAGRVSIVANFMEVETGVVIEAVRVEGPAGEQHVFQLQDDLGEAIREALPRIRERLRQ